MGIAIGALVLLSGNQVDQIDITQFEFVFLRSGPTERMFLKGITAHKLLLVVRPSEPRSMHQEQHLLLAQISGNEPLRNPAETAALVIIGPVRTLKWSASRRR